MNLNDPLCRMFEWYWTDVACKLLLVGTFMFANSSCYSPFPPFLFPARAVGCSEWPENTRKNCTMLTKGTSVDKTKQLFTPSTEAFMFIMFKNCHAKWTKVMEYYKKEGSYTKNMPERMTKKQKEEAGRKDEMHDALYSDANAGQKRFGSFSKEGVDEFKALTLEITNGRAEKDVLAEMHKVEKAFLNSYQKKCKDEGKKGDSSGKKRKRSALDDDDVEEEGEDIGEDWGDLDEI